MWTERMTNSLRLHLSFVLSSSLPSSLPPPFFGIDGEKLKKHDINTNGFIVVEIFIVLIPLLLGCYLFSLEHLSLSFHRVQGLHQLTKFVCTGLTTQCQGPILRRLYNCMTFIGRNVSLSGKRKGKKQ